MGRRKKNKLSKPKTIFLSIVALIVGVVIGFSANVLVGLPDSYQIPGVVESTSHTFSTGKINAEVIKESELSIHFLELGNKYTGDSTYIKVDNGETDVDILIDAGSKASSIPTIKNYVDQYLTDGILDYVVVTHAHEDHYAGFATNSSTQSLFDIYKVGTIIEFTQTNKTLSNKMYANYVREREEERESGATWFTALDCINGETDEKTGNVAQQVISLGSSTGVSMKILNHKYQTEKASSENDYSVCLLITQEGSTSEKDKHYLFTGDLEKEGEESLISPEMNNNLPKVDVYKAGHHGSKTSSSEEFLKVIQPKAVCVCCCAGSSEYTSKSENQFPTQIFINNVAEWTSNVYVTSICTNYQEGKFESMNGNIVVCANKDQDNTFQFSNNDTKLKDTEWFKANRTVPEKWRLVS